MLAYVIDFDAVLVEPFLRRLEFLQAVADLQGDVGQPGRVFRCRWGIRAGLQQGDVIGR